MNREEARQRFDDNYKESLEHSPDSPEYKRLVEENEYLLGVILG